MSTSNTVIGRRDRVRRAAVSLAPPNLPSFTRLKTAIRDALERRPQRRELREWADRNDQHLLRDIGVTRTQAYREAAKWFWQR